MILCGPQLNEKPLTRQQGEDLAATLGAYKYVECSSKARQGLNEVCLQMGMNRA